MSTSLDHTSCGMFSEYVFTLKVVSKYGAQDLNRLIIRFEIWGQAAILLFIDIDSLQQLNRMHGQSMGEISLSQHIQLHT